MIHKSHVETREINCIVKTEDNNDTELIIFIQETGEHVKVYSRCFLWCQVWSGFKMLGSILWVVAVLLLL